MKRANLGNRRTGDNWHPKTYTDSVPEVVYGSNRMLHNLSTPNPNDTNDPLDYPPYPLGTHVVRRVDDDAGKMGRSTSHRGTSFTGGNRRKFRGFRGAGTSIVYLDRVPDVIYDCPRTLNGICYPEFQEAGDILPTFVTPDDARKYIDEVDSGYNRLDSGISTAPNLTQDFKTSWGIQLTTWKAFAIASKASVGWLNTKAIMEQTDRFNDQLKNWFTEFTKLGGSGVGPMPTTPGQGIPGTTQVSDVTKLVIAGSVLAAIVFIAPKLLK